MHVNSVCTMEILLWVAHIFYVSCFIPQLFTNYWRKSTDGVSSTTIFIYFTGYFIEILYVYYLHLPLPFRAMIPLGACVAFILALQRIYYDARGFKLLKLIALYSSIVIFVCIGGLIGRWYPLVVGHIAGWLGTCMWLVYQIPQVWKVQKTESVRGFNFLFVLISGSGAIIEIVSAVVLKLPYQTLFNGLRGFTFTIIFAYQFWKYGCRRICFRYFIARH